MNAEAVLTAARQAGLKIATVESCTGGLVAAALTEVAGSSDVFERGFVTYSNRAKEEMLGVPGDALADYGAVSEPVARMMAEGALEASQRTSFNAVITDQNMPRMDGREVLKEMRADPSLKVIPVVVLTTSNHEKDILESYGLAANNYIVKPVDLTQFFNIIQQVSHFWVKIVALPPPP